MKVEYSSNNSGGDWWLTDQNWRDLEAAGWKVDWKANEKDWFGKPYEDGRWLGALATRATREGLRLRVAVAEWEDVTGLRAADAGCSCCGNPHSFSFEGDNGERDWNEVDPYDEWDDDWDYEDDEDD